MTAARPVGVGGATPRGPLEWARLAAVAVQFLTRIPVRVRFEPEISAGRPARSPRWGRWSRRSVSGCVGR